MQRSRKYDSESGKINQQKQNWKWLDERIGIERNKCASFASYIQEGREAREYHEKRNKTYLKNPNVISRNEIYNTLSKKNTLDVIKNRSDISYSRRNDQGIWRYSNKEKPKMKLREKIRQGKNIEHCDIWETIKQSSIEVIGDLDWGRSIKNIFEEIMVKKFPNLMKTKSNRFKKHKENHRKSYHNQIAESQW